jgi:hypothetical protein
MNDLVKYLVDAILLEEEETTITKIVAIYPGRFQPAYVRNYATFRWIQKIAMTNKIRLPEAPLSFEEKQNIWARHGIDSSKVVEVKNPFQATEILAKFDPLTTAVVYISTQEDLSEYKISIGNGYYKHYDKKTPLQNFKQHGYILASPAFTPLLVGSKKLTDKTVREILGSKMSNAAKQKAFKKIFGWWDEIIYSKIVPKFKNSTKDLNETNKRNEGLSK